MKKSLLVIFVLGLLLSLAIMPVAAGGNSGGGSNIQVVQPQHHKEGHVLIPGGFLSGGSTLYKIAPLDWDGFSIDVAGPGNVWIGIVDCCIMGDTMAAYAKLVGTGQVKAGIATSPGEIWLKFWVPSPQAIRVWVGYVDTPGGFPAGYNWFAYHNP